MPTYEEIADAQWRAQDEQDRLRTADPTAPIFVVVAEVLPQKVSVDCRECGTVGSTSADAAHHTCHTGHQTRVLTRSVTRYSIEEASR